jgi:hypothetical protein
MGLCCRGLHALPAHANVQTDRQAAEAEQCLQHVELAGKVLGLAHLQCNSIKLREAPPVARSTGEVSRNRCMHCRVDTAVGDGQQGHLTHVHAGAVHAAAACTGHSIRTHDSGRSSMPCGSSPWSC